MLPEEELDLIQFAARQLTETGAGAAEVVGRQLGDASDVRTTAAAARTTSHRTFAVMPSPQTRPPLLRNAVLWVMHAAVVHASTAFVTQVSMGTVRTCPPLLTSRRPCSGVGQWSVLIS
jgi:hypothetical protein